MRNNTWKAIPGLEGYEASDHGQIRSYWKTSGTLSDKPRTLAGARTKSGYLYYRLRTAKAQAKGFLGHRLVALTFHGKPPYPNSYATHINGKPWDNRANNIRWGTAKSNSADALHHGTRLYGVKIESSRLLPELVLAIRWLYANRGITQRQLTELFAVSKGTISKIVCGETWKHLLLDSPESHN